MNNVRFTILMATSLGISVPAAAATGQSSLFVGATVEPSCLVSTTQTNSAIACSDGAQPSVSTAPAGSDRVEARDPQPSPAAPGGESAGKSDVTYVTITY